MLFLPFGEGAVDEGASPELLRQPSDTEPDDAEQVVIIQAMFLDLTPDYTPDVVIVGLRKGTPVRDALFEIEDVRHQDRRKLFPWVLPAQPQIAQE